MGPLELKRIKPNDRLWALLIDTLWKDNPALYIEKYLSEADPEDPKQLWLRNKISADINFAQALGQDHNLEGNRSAAFGQGGVTKSFLEIVLGAYNIIPTGQNAEEWISTDLLFTLANGTDKDHRSNVFEVYKSGFIKFLNAVKFGEYNQRDESGELIIPENGTIQWTVDGGLEEWDTDRWVPVRSKFTFKDFTFIDTDDIVWDIDPVAKTVKAYTNGITGTFVDNDENIVTYRRGLIIDNAIDPHYTLTVIDGSIELPE